MIDDRSNLVFVQECIHSIKRRARCYGDTTNGCLAKDERHQIQLDGLPSQKSNLRDATGCLGGRD